MLHIAGESGGEYLNLRCKGCGGSINLRDLRYDGPVPVVTAECRECGEEGSFKLHPTTWMNVLPQRS